MGEARRVALLARPGEACEKLRAALREAGGDIVIEADPSTLDPQQLRVAAVETVLVALDPAVEDALEKFDDVLGDRAIEVIFDEADLAARREGWDAARWVRHLSAKLHRHDDVLPPGREPEDDDVAPPAIDIDVSSLDDLSLELKCWCSSRRHAVGRSACSSASRRRSRQRIASRVLLPRGTAGRSSRASRGWQRARVMMMR